MDELIVLAVHVKILMKLVNLINLVMIYTLSMFNTGQVTLPKKWREKQGTSKFVAEETDKGLLIKPIKKDEIVYYENDERVGIYCENGIDPQLIIDAIDKIDGKN